MMTTLDGFSTAGGVAWRRAARGARTLRVLDHAVTRIFLAAMLPMVLVAVLVWGAGRLLASPPTPASPAGLPASPAGLPASPAGLP